MRANFSERHRTAMSTPAGQNLSVGPLDIDLGGLVSGPGSTTVSIDSVSGGMSAAGGVSASAGVELSFGAPGGIPQVSASVGGGISAGGESSIGGSYDSIDLTTDQASGTTEVSVQSGEAEVSGYGGAALEAGVEVDLVPIDGGTPEIGVSGGVGYDSYGGYDVQGGYEEVEIEQDGGDASYLG